MFDVRIYSVGVVMFAFLFDIVKFVAIIGIIYLVVKGWTYD